MIADLKEDARAADGIPVEVKLHNGGYFPAFLMDIIKGEALIHFPYNWMPEDKYNFSKVRFPPAESTPRSALKEKMIAEVLINQHQGFHKGWFKCSIQMLKSEFCLFEYLDSQNGSDFGYICNLRKLNMNPKLSMDMFHIHKIVIPDDLREYAKCKDAHTTFKEIIKPAIVNYDEDRGELVIISRNIADISRVKLLQVTHLAILSRKVHVLKLNPPLQMAQRGGFTVEFTVPTSYVGFAIGRNKVHLRAAKNIKGVGIIKLIRRIGKFIIHGETEEAVNQARKLLEIKTEPYLVLIEHMSQLVQRESAKMYKIVEASGAAEIYVENLKTSLEGNLTLFIIGNAQAIEKAEIFLQFQIDYICDVQRLRGNDLTNEISIFAQTTSTPKIVSFVNSSNYNMNELEELDKLNELLLEDYDEAINLDVILENSIDLGDYATTDINQENTTARDSNQEDSDLIDNISRLNVSKESNGIAVLNFKSKPDMLLSTGVYHILRKHVSTSETRSFGTQVQEDDLIISDTKTSPPTLAELKSKMTTKKRFATPEKNPVEAKKLKFTSPETSAKSAEEEAFEMKQRDSPLPQRDT